MSLKPLLCVFMFQYSFVVFMTTNLRVEIQCSASKTLQVTSEDRNSSTDSLEDI